jgi:hypothetical protein
MDPPDISNPGISIFLVFLDKTHALALSPYTTNPFALSIHTDPSPMRSFLVAIVIGSTLLGGRVIISKAVIGVVSSSESSSCWRWLWFDATIC